MGISLNQRNFSRRKKQKVISEINVTPMVDVMLVLLIIFMITSPMLVTGVNVDLPKTDASALPAESKPLVISMNKNQEIFIFETKIEQSELIEKITNIVKENKDTRIFVKGDKNLPYGLVIELMAMIHNSGFTKVALVSDPK